MLCLTIKPQSSVQVGQATITNVTPKPIKIGITAPRIIPIIRDDAKCKERKDSA